MNATGQSCCEMAEMHNLSFNDFVVLNPGLDCDNLTAVSSVCVQSTELCLPEDTCSSTGPITIKLADKRKDRLYKRGKRVWAGRATELGNLSSSSNTDLAASKGSGWVCDYWFYECDYFYNWYLWKNETDSHVERVAEEEDLDVIDGIGEGSEDDQERWWYYYWWW